MRLGHIPGDHAFKALYREHSDLKEWILSKSYFLTQKEVTEFFGTNEVIWPVEVLDNDVVYIPDQSELI